MAHCRYCNRFRLTRTAGPGAWLLDCGHTYLPLPSETQTWAAYMQDGRRRTAICSPISAPGL